MHYQSKKNLTRLEAILRVRGLRKMAPSGGAVDSGIIRHLAPPGEINYVAFKFAPTRWDADESSALGEVADTAALTLNNHWKGQR